NADLPIKSMLVIGNVNIKRQLEKLKKKPQIIIGSTGRIAELIRLKKIKSHTVKTIIIDEVDVLLLSDNYKTIQAIIKTTQRDRQLLFFSATISKKIMGLIKPLSEQVEEIRIKDTEVMNSDIEHIYFKAAEPRDKIKILRKAVHAMKPTKAIVFIHKTMDVEYLCERLQYHKITAANIHGCSNKMERQKAIQDFRAGKVQLLIASDIAARGLDIKEVTHIFNLDIPSSSYNYTHRVGRTGRAGLKGTAVSIITGKENFLIRRFKEELKIDIPLKQLKEGEVVD
ncbi:MAG: ATP-dependent RNA helicase DeaD, partial [bacterium]